MLLKISPQLRRMSNTRNWTTLQQNMLQNLQVVRRPIELFQEKAPSEPWKTRMLLGTHSPQPVTKYRLSKCETWIKEDKSGWWRNYKEMRSPDKRMHWAHSKIHGFGFTGFIPCSLSNQNWERKHNEFLSLGDWNRPKNGGGWRKYALSFLFIRACRWLLLFS